jgi:hypothetical protein
LRASYTKNIENIRQTKKNIEKTRKIENMRKTREKWQKAKTIHKTRTNIENMRNMREQRQKAKKVRIGIYQVFIVQKSFGNREASCKSNVCVTKLV